MTTTNSGLFEMVHNQIFTLLKVSNYQAN